MIDRINKNEQRFDMALDSIKNLQDSLDKYIANKKNIELVKKYYGSNNWFKDKEAYETGKIPKLKAGILSEDAVWDMLDEIDDAIEKMRIIIKSNML